MTAVLTLVCLFALLALGVPIAFALALAGLPFLVFATGAAPDFILGRLFVGVDSYPLTAIPLFMLAASLMNRGGVSKRLTTFAATLVGPLWGGLAMITIAASAMFGAVCGTCAGTAAAIGPIMIPSMMQNKYAPRFAAAVTSASSSLGIIIPPSVPMILYGAISGVSVADMFITGIPLGIYIALGYGVAAFFISRHYGYRPYMDHWELPALLRSFVAALPGLSLPVVILGGIMLGIMTPTETAAVAVVCALLAGLFVYRELDWVGTVSALREAVANTAIVMFIVGTAAVLGWCMTYLKIPHSLMASLMPFASTPASIMWVTSFAFFLGGFILDGTVMVLVLGPLFLPLARAAGIDLLQFGMVIFIVWAIGQQTPPVASGLFIPCALAKCSMGEASKDNIWFILTLFVVLAAMIHAPDAMLYLPRLLIGANP